MAGVSATGSRKRAMWRTPRVVIAGRAGSGRRVAAVRARSALAPGPGTRTGRFPPLPGSVRGLGGRRAAHVAGAGRNPGTAGRFMLEMLMFPYQAHCRRCAVSRYRIVMALACMAAAGCAAPPAVTHTAQARAGGAVWGRAIEVPGLGRLNAGGEAQVSVVSCASAGNCAAGGFYRDRSRHSQAWVASQVNGRWGTAIEVPGTAALNADGEAHVSAVSCGSAGNCMAGGSYKSLHGRFQAWVASQVNGRWGTAIVVPGTAALNAGGAGGVASVSCASAGTCTAGGSYTGGSGRGNSQGFVASQVNGRWGTAIEVPGTAALNAGGNAEVTSVACASAGNCTAGGFYADGSGSYSLAFVASQRNGRWGTAIEVPGTAALNPAGDT